MVADSGINSAKRLSLWVCALLVSAPGSALAADVAASSGADVIAPISIVQTKSINFRSFSSGASGGTISVSKDPTPVIATTGDVEAVTSGIVSKATFRVNGEDGAAYSVIRAAAASVILSGPGAPMALTAFDDTDNLSGQILGGGANAAGQDFFHYGASMDVGPDQTPGSYAATYAVSVAYD